MENVGGVALGQESGHPPRPVSEATKGWTARSPPGVRVVERVGGSGDAGLGFGEEALEFGGQLGGDGGDGGP